MTHLARTLPRLRGSSIRTLTPRPSVCTSQLLLVRHEHTSPAASTPVPLRKQFKDELKARKKAKRSGLQDQQNAASSAVADKVSNPEEWELTVGIEVHAELNTARKLFSDALTVDHDAGREQSGAGVEPNTHVAPFDAALPGTQPVFQIATLIPAIRAALALGCDVQTRSSWDRKHYFYHDQPNGYQITQHYEPLAKNGAIWLDPDKTNKRTCVGIKQVQIEQDTAKSTAQGSQQLIDLNRVSHPLVEIVTLPQISSPKMAGDVGRKIQSLLRAVDACVGGMESGSLRADVNVSVRRRGTVGAEQYESVKGLGTRTEIKNLSSFKAIEDAVAAERNRQIAVLQAGGKVESETRGWSVGSVETTLLRGKEGTIDYRYMPDPDLGPILLDDKLVQHLQETLPELPDALIDRVIDDFGLTLVDARALCFQDDGDRLEFLAEAVDHIMADSPDMFNRKQIGKVAGNWILHELGGLLKADSAGWDAQRMTSRQFSELLAALLKKEVTARTAKTLLRRCHSGELVDRSISEVIEKENLALRSLSDEGYQTLAQSVLDDHQGLVAEIRASGDMRKSMFLVGQMMRRAEEGTVEPSKAKDIVEQLLKLKG